MIPRIESGGIGLRVRSAVRLRITYPPDGIRGYCFLSGYIPRYALFSTGFWIFMNFARSMASIHRSLEMCGTVGGRGPRDEVGREPVIAPRWVVRSALGGVITRAQRITAQGSLVGGTPPKQLRWSVVHSGRVSRLPSEPG